MSWGNIFGRMPEQTPIVQEYERKHTLELPQAKDVILDNLEIAVCDCNGKRFKERDVVRAMKTVSRL